MLSPIVLFTYNRPLETQRILDSLSANAEAKASILYIYCDGPKQDADGELLAKIEEVRTICRGEKRFETVIVIEQEFNKGLAKSIIDGVTDVVNKYGRIIVLEDDLVVSPFFLLYMNDSLTRYENHPRVASIGACNFFACGKKYPNFFFINMPDSWGWATWQSKWKDFNPDARALYADLKKKNLMHKFNAYGSYDMEGLLLDQIEGNGSSWAIRWTSVCVLNDWLTLYPNPSVTNHVESKTATHAFLNIVPPLCAKAPEFETVEVKEMPEVVEAMKRGYSGTGDYYGKVIPRGNYKDELFRKIKSFVPVSLLKWHEKHRNQPE